MRTLAENPDLRDRLGKNGRQAIERHFDWNHYQEELCRFLTRLPASN
jgi:glycosyltransferase involved in cell wall biosynthesis